MKRRGQCLVAVILLAIFVRLAAAFALGIDRVETFEPESIANHILSGQGFRIEHYGTWYRTFGSPPFAYLCAGVYRLFAHSHLAMLLVQSACSAIAVLGCFSIGRLLFSDRVAWVASLLVALHPGLLLYDAHKIHPLSLDAALAVLGLWMVLLLRLRPSVPAAAFGGTLHGLAIFERSAQVGLVPLTLFSLRQSSRGSMFLKHGMAYGIAIIIVMAPWTIRNFLLYQRPVFVSTTSAEVFWRGNNSAASGDAYAKGRPGVPTFEAAPVEFQREVFGKDEITQSQIFFHEAITYIVHHPTDVLLLYVRKFFNFWWFSSHAGFLYPGGYLILYQGYYTLLLGFALIGFIKTYWEGRRRHQWEWTKLPLFILSVSFLQSLFYVETRHRWGVEPLLLLFTARGILSVGESLQGIRMGMAEKKPCAV